MVSIKVGQEEKFINRQLGWRNSVKRTYKAVDRAGKQATPGPVGALLRMSKVIDLKSNKKT
ncbi:hypothetical protein GCM10023172_29600 [Hymenobacter ginsengisoli]|uniref:Uncharacterized protein n=1 Tax=Hymenobacter ginsengisoli TaxID=1051626 RepID=A0ABP8QKU5_9BACT